MATHSLPCPRRARCSSPPFAGWVWHPLLRSSIKKRGILRWLCVSPPWIKSPLLSLYHTWFLPSCTAAGSTGVRGEARAAPKTPRQQLFSEDNILPCAFHGFIHTIHKTTYLPSIQASRADTLLKRCPPCPGCTWDVSGARVWKLLFCSCMYFLKGTFFFVLLAHKVAINKQGA